jgi:hypothetical protein
MVARLFASSISFGLQCARRECAKRLTTSESVRTFIYLSIPGSLVNLSSLKNRLIWLVLSVQNQKPYRIMMPFTLQHCTILGKLINLEGKRI